MAAKFDGGAPFAIAADIDRKGTPFVDRTTAYLVNKDGIVEQVFPMVIHVRPSWGAFLDEVDKLQSKRSKN